MRLTAILFSFCVIAVIVCGLVYVGAMAGSTAVTDTMGSAPSAVTNGTASMLETVTATGTAGAAGLILLLGCLCVLGAIFLIRKYAGR